MRTLKTFAGVVVFAVLMLASTSCGSDPNLLFIQIIPASQTLTTSNQTAQFIANGIYERGPDQDVTNQATWASSKESVATITSTGLATASACPFDATHTNGTTTITASLDGKVATAQLTVNISFCP